MSGRYNLTFQSLTFSGLTFDVGSDININAVNKAKDELYQLIDIKLPDWPDNVDSLRVKADTGAQGNLLPLRVYAQMFPNAVGKDNIPINGALEPSTITLRACGGSVIKQYGKVNLRSRFRNDWKDTEFFVADVPGPTLLGFPSMMEHDVITVNPPPKNAPTEATFESVNVKPRSEKLANLINKYPDRFTGISEFEKEYNIELKEDAVPVIQPPR